MANSADPHCLLRQGMTCLAREGLTSLRIRLHVTHNLVYVRSTLFAKTVHDVFSKRRVSIALNSITCDAYSCVRKILKVKTAEEQTH